VVGHLKGGVPVGVGGKLGYRAKDLIANNYIYSNYYMIVLTIYTGSTMPERNKVTILNLISTETLPTIAPISIVIAKEILVTLLLKLKAREIVRLARLFFPQKSFM
jgi:hypothetical protein